MNRYSYEIVKDDSRLKLFFQLMYAETFYSPMHWHSHLEVIFVLDGYMTVYVNEKKYTLKKDDIFLVNSKEIHAARSSGKVNYILLQIPYDYLSGAISQMSLLQFQAYYPSITTTATQKELRECLFNMLEIYSAQEDGYALAFSGELFRFLHILYKHHSKRITWESKEKENRNLEKIEEITLYVKANYQKDISLSEVADLLNISPEYFCRMFKKHTGQTFMEYLNAVRMMHFYQDLIETNYSINDLLERNGIHNYKVFIRMFKDTYKSTPHKLRKELSANAL